MTSRKPNQEDVEKGREVARWRQKRRLSQAAVGDLVGKSGSQISKYELGKNRMSATTYETLLRALGPGSLRPPGLAEGQADYVGPSGGRLNEIQFLDWMIDKLERRKKDLGGA